MINMNFNPTEEEIRIVSKALDDFNFEIVENENHKVLNIVKYDDEGNIIAGLLGGTYWGWLYIDRLWVKRDYQKSGIGSSLLIEAEKEALVRGCEYAHLDTMSFQALDFYKKHKYKVKTTINNIPKGHKKYLLIKKLKKEKK